MITSISLDHIAILGDTIEKIAFEKCGIIKENVPVVTSANQHSDALKVIKDTCEKRNCDLIITDPHKTEIHDDSIFGTVFSYDENGEFYKKSFCVDEKLYDVYPLTVYLPKKSVMKFSFSVESKEIPFSIDGASIYYKLSDRKH